MQKIIACLRLMRPANIVTAIADIMLGFAVSGLVHSPLFKNNTINIDQLSSLGWLVLSTIGLYGGGVVLNDVFDAEIDKLERPERPIPSGRVSKTEGAVLGVLLLLAGIAAASMVSLLSAAVALSIAVLALSYDSLGKHHNFLGPINMGACRGGNLLLGISAVYSSVAEYWYMALIPVIYIAAITMISRGEVHGGRKDTFKFAFFLYGLVIVSVTFLSFLKKEYFLHTIPFLLLFSYLIFPPLYRAMKLLQPQLIGKAVKAGVLALIVLDATIASGFAGGFYGLLVLSLLPLSRLLAKTFAVT